jgi:hypothetical protein
VIEQSGQFVVPAGRPGIARQALQGAFQAGGLGFWLTTSGLIASFVGDYWANGAGFFLELLGLLVLVVGCLLTGMAAWRSKLLPEWSAALLMVCLPGYVAWSRLIGHIPINSRIR